MCLGCLGPAVQPPNDKAACFVTLIKVTMVILFFLMILDFISIKYILFGIFSLVAIFILYIVQHQISYQLLMYYIFISIFFSILFLIEILTPVQRDNWDTFDSQDKLQYVVAVINFLFWTFSLIIFFFPYREFKKIAYGLNPSLRGFFDNQRQEDNNNRRNQRNNQSVNNNYRVDYGDIEVDRNRRNNDRGNFEIYQGQGVKVG